MEGLVEIDSWDKRLWSTALWTVADVLYCRDSNILDPFTRPRIRSKHPMAIRHTSIAGFPAWMLRSCGLYDGRLAGSMIEDWDRRAPVIMGVITTSTAGSSCRQVKIHDGPSTISMPHPMDLSASVDNRDGPRFRGSKSRTSGLPCVCRDPNNRSYIWRPMSKTDWTACVSSSLLILCFVTALSAFDDESCCHLASFVIA